MYLIGTGVVNRPVGFDETEAWAVKWLHRKPEDPAQENIPMSSEVQPKVINVDDPDKRFQANPNYLLREIGGESILVTIGDAGELSNSVISLNETSSFLWQQFQSPTTIQESIAEAEKLYTDSAGVMAEHIKVFVISYLKIGLLQEV